MQICHSSAAQARPIDDRIATLLDTVCATYLREIVDAIAKPRHFLAESTTNRRIGVWLADRLQSYGYKVSFEGQYANVVALPANVHDADVILIGAHYDSVPGTPGADDNASAVAALLGCARAVSAAATQHPICFVAFNREEDGLLGSHDFVAHYLAESGMKIRQAHILEMVGYCGHNTGSQHLPPGLPIEISDVGDFLGLIGNQDSIALVDDVLTHAKSYLPTFPVTGLKVYKGMEKHFPPLERSDHVPFWRAGMPALMWTDTSEYRNPNYHRLSDTPDTLDYSFLRSVTQLLIVQALSCSSISSAALRSDDRDQTL